MTATDEEVRPMPDTEVTTVPSRTTDDEFDLDLRVEPGWFDAPSEIRLSGTCGGCPDWTEEGSSCQVTCDASACGQCTMNPGNPDCGA